MIEKKLKDYLHLFLGCECMWKVFGDDDIEFKKSSIDLKILDRVYDRQPFVIKPILRPLSSMTEDECGDIYTIERDRFLGHKTIDFDVRKSDNGFVVTRIDLLDDRLMIGFYGQIYKIIEDGTSPHIEPIRNQHEITRYLLSKHFDLFGLIESGLAIDKTNR